MTWCGNYVGGWGSPCKLEVVLAVVLLFILIPVLAFQARRLQILRHRRVSRSRESGYTAAALRAIYALVTAVHLAWLIAVCILREAAAFQIFCEAIYFVVWANILVSKAKYSRATRGGV